MTRTARQILSWFCLVLQLTAAAATFGRVLCVAADGHVALEVAHPGSCETETRRHHPLSPAGITLKCSDHPCTDIAVWQRALQPQPRADDDHTSSQVAVILPHHIIEASLVAPNRLNAIGAWPCGDAIRARRSIVLLV